MDQETGTRGITKLIYNDTIGRGIAIVRCRVQITDVPTHAERVDIEVIDLKKFDDATGERGVLLRLECLLSQVRISTSEIQTEDCIAIYAKGPTFDRRVLTEKDWLEELDSVIGAWLANRTYGLWSYPRAFAGSIQFLGTDSFLPNLPASHPLILPYLTRALGLFKGNYADKLRIITQGRDGPDRAIALASFRSRFDAFIAQSLKEVRRQIIGEPFKG